MKLSGPPHFLALHTEPSKNVRTLEVSKSLGAVLGGWTPGTRVSPIWQLNEFGQQLPKGLPSCQSATLMFLGPIAPSKLLTDIDLSECRSRTRCWMTMGSFNVILMWEDNILPENFSDLRKWLCSIKVPHEVWTISDNVVGAEPQIWCPDEAPSELLKRLKQLSSKSYPVELKSHVQEFCTLSASATARSSAFGSSFLKEINGAIEIFISRVQDYLRGDADALEIQSEVISINAGLSRFASQTFSGTSPITATECHFWTHSLLGTGTANRALHELVNHVSDKIGQARIPERLAMLENLTDNVPGLIDLGTDHTLLTKDILARSGEPVADAVYTPLISYFSGRDGYSSYLQTVSAPLAAISECNSYGTNILTVTHELGHVLTRAVFAEIFPNKDHPEEITTALQMLSPDYTPETWRDSAAKYLVEGLVALERAESEDEFDIDQYDETFVKSILNAWRDEAQEVVVHSIDFLYFYKDNPDFYIEAIWNSWGAIHGIGDRISEYLLRTISAISCNLLKETPRDRTMSAVRAVHNTLTRIAGENSIRSGYAIAALEQLAEIFKIGDGKVEVVSEEGFASLQIRLGARLYFVRLAHIFLYSESISSQFLSDAFVGSKGSRTRNLTIEEKAIENPLRFLRDHLKPETTDTESLWVLLNLAFNIDREATA